MVKLTLLASNGNLLRFVLPEQRASHTLEQFLELLLKDEKADPLMLRYFYWLLKEPELTVGRKLVLYLNGLRVERNNCLELQEENLLELKLGALIFVEQFPSIKTRNIIDYQACQPFINHILTEAFDFQKFPVNQVKSFEELKETFPSLSIHEKLGVLYRFAQIVYDAPFENYSKILLQVNFMTPLMMWRNIYQSHGGICSEKVSAFKFVCDVLGVDSKPVFGGLKHDLDTEEYLVRFYKSGGRQKLPFWLNHHLLEVYVDDRQILIDVTNGNLPFLFLDEKDAELRYENGMKCRMVYEQEKFSLRKSTELAGDLLQNISEYGSSLLPFKYIFKQKLGLLVTDNYYIGLYTDWHAQRSRVMQQYYSNLARKNGFPFPAFYHKENLKAISDETLKNLIESSLQAMGENYPLKEFCGNFVVVVQPLRSRDKRRVSDSLYKLLTELSPTLEQVC